MHLCDMLLHDLCERHLWIRKVQKLDSKYLRRLLALGRYEVDVALVKRCRLLGIAGE